MSWEQTPLSAVATIIMGQSPPGFTYNQNGQGLPFFQGVKDFGSRYPVGQIYCSHPTKVAEEGDTLFSVRAPIGRINRANQQCVIGRGLSIIRAKRKSDANFIEFLLRSMHRLWSVYESQGAIFGNMRKYDLENLRISWPPENERVRIASILSAYDDLIENNHRRIQLLEQVAEMLYKEWFMHFRFPGHNSNAITGGIPRDWKKKRLDDHVTLVRGVSYKSGDLIKSGGRPFINLKCVARHGGFNLSGVKYFNGKSKEEQIIHPGDIVIAVTDMTRERQVVAHPARIPLTVGEVATFSLDIVKVMPDETFDKIWFYHFLRHSDFSKKVREHATGTNVLHLNPKEIENYKFYCPHISLQTQFGEFSKDILSKQDNLIMQNEKLACARDSLLSYLIKKEVRS